MSTPAIYFLKQKHITHEVITYLHQEKGAEFAARTVGFPLSQIIKTLVVSLDNKSYALILMPGDRQLSLKKIAGVCRTKRAAMADTESAQRLTGYLIGGISPFGIKKRLQVIMEQQLLSYNHVMINGGRRGVLLKMRPEDIFKTLNAKICDLIQI